MSIIEDIYYGKLLPSEQVVPKKDDEYWRLYSRASNLIDEFKDTLSEADYAKLNEICNCLTDCQDLMCMAFYKFGLSMGLLLMKEAVDNPYLRKENE